MSVRYEINSSILSAVKSHLSFPKHSTVLDLYAEEGTQIFALTFHENVSCYAASETYANYVSNKLKNKAFSKVIKSHFQATPNITNDAFSFAIVYAPVNYTLSTELFSRIDPYSMPNFDVEERKRIEATEAQQMFLDIDDSLQNPEELKKRKEDIEQKIQKAIDERKKGFIKNIRDAEKRIDHLRRDKLQLSMTAKYIAKDGIMVMFMPKEFLDHSNCNKLASCFTDIQIYRPQDYDASRRLVIFAKRKSDNQRNNEVFARLCKFQSEIKYADIPLLEHMEQPMYHIPDLPASRVVMFRIGPVTEDEAQQLLQQSKHVASYFDLYQTSIENEKPQPPTQLRKGHVSLCLASGLLNGYIGTGPDQHLVKGSVVKVNQQVIEEDENESTLREIERFHVGIKYLDRYGKFHRLL